MKQKNLEANASNLYPHLCCASHALNLVASKDNRTAMSNMQCKKKMYHASMGGVRHCGVRRGRAQNPLIKSKIYCQDNYLFSTQLSGILDMML